MNVISARRFVIYFGVVSALADFVYEGSRSVVGPYLATLGASAALVGVVTGAGEAVALVFRLVSGPLADRTRRYWALSIAGYAVTLISVPLLAVARPLAAASSLVIAERFGKAVRTPARDTMLSQASTDMGRGWGFAIHETLDQTGAFAGPLLVALVLYLGGGYRLGFAVLAVPAALSLLILARLRKAAPDPAAYEDRSRDPGAATGASTDSFLSSWRNQPRRLWLYSLFTALTMFGYATFALLAYHLQVRHVMPAAEIPVLYAVAMGIGALVALPAGRVYDRIGLQGLVVLPLLSAIVPFLSFSREVALVWLGAAAWGAVTGIHESTMRAAVADLIPADRRGAAYGIFTSIYGVAWLAGSALIGLLYSFSINAVIVFVLFAQALALLSFVPLAKEPRLMREAPH